MEDSIKTMSDTVTKLTKMMEIMAETRNKDREDYEKEQSRGTRKEKRIRR